MDQDVLIVCTDEGDRFFLLPERWIAVLAAWESAEPEMIQERTLGGGKVAIDPACIAWVAIETAEDRRIARELYSLEGPDEPWKV